LCLGCNDATRREQADVDLTKPDKSCEVHGVPLQEGVVPIKYGLRKPTEEEIEASTKLFPHAKSDYNPGCVEEEAKRARVNFCPECRKAEAAWKAKREAAK
jgi:hypothetical protein